MDTAFLARRCLHLDEFRNREGSRTPGDQRPGAAVTAMHPGKRRGRGTGTSGSAGPRAGCRARRPSPP